MSNVDLLINLLRTIAESGESAKGLEELSSLLRKISKTTIHIHIDVDYDGREFRWKVPVKNMTAADWQPKGKE